MSHRAQLLATCRTPFVPGVFGLRVGDLVRDECEPRRWMRVLGRNPDDYLSVLAYIEWQDDVLPLLREPSQVEFVCEFDDAYFYLNNRVCRKLGFEVPDDWA